MTCFKLANRLLQASVAAAAGVALLTTPMGVSAMEPYPEEYQVEQPDGSILKVKMGGSEEDPMEYDEDGYAVIGGGPSGNEYFYGEPDEETGDIVPSRVRAGDRSKRPKGLRKGLRRTGEAHNSMGLGGSGRLAKKRTGGPGRGRAPRRRMEHIDLYEEWNEATEDFHRRTMDWTGVKKNLVVPMRFKGHESRWLPTKANLEILFNNVGPDPTYAPTGSVRDVFKVSSYGKLDMQSIVEDWVQLSQTEAYYANGARGFTTVMHQAMREALDILESRGTDFKQFDTDNDGLIDAICFLHSGYAAEWGGNAEDGANYLDRIWSHKWSLYSFRYPSTSTRSGWTSPTHNVRVYNYHISPAVYGTYPSSRTNIKDKMGRIGVIAHETGHFLGITDLYDTSGDPGSGIGSWGLMANSWGFANNQWCIPIMSPWSKIDLKWLTPKTISASGSFSISPSYDTQDVYRIDAGFPSNEYLLIEYRKKMGFESCMPGNGGLAIWHIDDNADYNHQGWPGQAGWPSNGKHYRISLLAADGKYDLEQSKNRGDITDLFYSGHVTYLGPGTKSGTTVYPNTDSYQSGNIQETGIEVKNIGAPGTKLSFEVVIPVAPTKPPTKSPTKVPSKFPTKAPTRAPSKFPTKAPSSAPSKSPTKSPVMSATDTPTTSPVVTATDSPTASPVVTTTGSPTTSPVVTATDSPTTSPVLTATDSPSASPVKTATESPTKAPVATATESPTTSPVAVSTPAPTGGPVTCRSWEYKVEIDITTDDFGSETSWVLEDQYKGLGVLKSGGPYTDEIKSYHYEYCVAKRSCYKFVLSDNSGDGIDAAGAWKVTVNGEVEGEMKESYAFDKDGVDFGFKCLPDGGSVATAGLKGSDSFFGTMFDIEAKEDIYIRRFAFIHTAAANSYTYRVFTKNGSHRGYERDSSAWTLVQNMNLTGAGLGSYTFTNNVNFNRHVMALSGTRQAFYVVLDKKELVVESSSDLAKGDVYKTFDEFNLLAGTCNTRLFGDFPGDLSCGFNGKITIAPARLEVSGSLGAMYNDKDLPDDQLPEEVAAEDKSMDDEDDESMDDEEEEKDEDKDEDKSSKFGRGGRFSFGGRRGGM